MISRMSKSTRRIVTVIAMTGGSLVGVAAGANPASAYLAGCSGGYAFGTSTRSYCTTNVGGGLQRARHTCSSAGHGTTYYGSWTGAGPYSTTASCGGTISNRSQEFTN